LHADYCPPGRCNQDGQMVLERVNEALNNFASAGMQIIQNYPLAIGKVWEQLKMALSNVQTTGLIIFRICFWFNAFSY